MKTIIALVLLMVCASKIDAQLNEWTWVKGDSTFRNRDVYGVKGIASAGNKPGCRYASATTADNLGNLWLYGGGGSANGADKGDLWKYEISSNNWTWMSGDSVGNTLAVYGTKGISSPANSPGARQFSTAWTDAAGNLWLFGGYGYGAVSTSSGPMNDLWKYNPATNEWTWIKGDTVPYALTVYGTQGVSNPANTPGGRAQAIPWIDGAGNLWIYGGSWYGSYNEIWRYNIATSEWTWMKGGVFNASPIYGVRGVPSPANDPGGRIGAHWTDTFGNLWFFGGDIYKGGSDHFYRDLWQYNISTNVWTWMSGDSSTNDFAVYGSIGIASSSNKIGSRITNTSWKDADGNFWVFGGYGYGSWMYGGLGDLWKYNKATDQWIWMRSDSSLTGNGYYGIQGISSGNTLPLRRNWSCTWVDNTGSFWLFAGAGNLSDGTNGTLSDLWRYTPSTALPSTSSPSPPNSQQPAVSSPQ